MDKKKLYSIKFEPWWFFVLVCGPLTTLWVVSRSDKNIQSGDLDWRCRKCSQSPLRFEAVKFLCRYGGFAWCFISMSITLNIVQNTAKIKGSFTRFVEYNRKIRSKSNKIYVTCSGKSKHIFPFFDINLLENKLHIFLIKLYNAFPILEIY